MKIINGEQNNNQWLSDRVGKITGSKVGGLISKKDGSLKKAGLYEFLAEQIAMESDDENPMDRGHRLEEEAIKAYESETGNMTEQVGTCVRDDNEKIACSPDRLVKGVKGYFKGVEVKCLASSKHIQSFIEQKIPAEYEEQILQYFIVIDELEAVDVVFYDPRVTIKPMHIITYYREDYKDEIAYQMKNEISIIKQVEDIITKLTF